PRAPGAVPRGPGAARRRAAPEPRPGAPRARVLHVLSRELGARGLDPRARAGPRAGRSQAALMHARAAANSFSRARTNCLAAVMGATYRARPWGKVGRCGWWWSIEGGPRDQLLRDRDILDRPQGPHCGSGFHASRRRPTSPDS